MLGLAEVRKMGESIVQTKRGNLFCFIGSTPGQKGVGFLNNKKWRTKVELNNFEYPDELKTPKFLFLSVGFETLFRNRSAQIRILFSCQSNSHEKHWTEDKSCIEN